MLYIDPEECIDCDACVEACPVDACFAEDQLPEEWNSYIQINAAYFDRPAGA
jgi:ferredoxin